MSFGREIIRGVRLAAILIVLGLVSLTVYRMLDLVDHEDTTNAASAPATAAPAAVKPGTKQSKGSQFFPPPPPPLPGRAVAAKPVAHGKDIIVVNVPAARESIEADAVSPVPADLPPVVAVEAPVVAQPEAPAPAPPAPVQRSNRFVRSMRRLLHIGK